MKTRKIIAVIAAVLTGIWTLLLLLCVWGVFSDPSPEEHPLGVIFGKLFMIVFAVICAAGALSDLLLFFACRLRPSETPAGNRLRVAALIAAGAEKAWFYLSALLLGLLDRDWAGFVPVLWGVSCFVCIILLIAAAIKNRKRAAPSGEEANNL